MSVCSYQNTEHWPKQFISLQGVFIHFEHSFVSSGSCFFFFFNPSPGGAGWGGEKMQVSLGSLRFC